MHLLEKRTFLTTGFTSLLEGRGLCPLSQRKDDQSGHLKERDFLKSATSLSLQRTCEISLQKWSEIESKNRSRDFRFCTVVKSATVRSEHKAI